MCLVSVFILLLNHSEWGVLITYFTAAAAAAAVKFMSGIRECCVIDAKLYNAF